MNELFLNRDLKKKERERETGHHSWTKNISTEMVEGFGTFFSTVASLT